MLTVVSADAAPKPSFALSITNGVSGFILSINFSTGNVAGGGTGVLSAVLASGLFMGMPELAGKNLSG